MMERMRVIALVVAVVLAVCAILLDCWAISDWRQNAIDTAAIVASAACAGAWVIWAMAWLHLKERRHLDGILLLMGRAKAQRDAAETLRQLRIEVPTDPLRLRNVK